MLVKAKRSLMWLRWRGRGPRGGQLLVGIIARHTAVREEACACVCPLCQNEDVSPDGIYQHIPAPLSISSHICPLSSIYFLNPALLPLPVFHKLCIRGFFPAPTRMSFTAFSFPPVSPSLHKHLSPWLFFTRSMALSLFSPCIDPIQMASRCCCNSFAFTYISSTNTAKKTWEEILRVHSRKWLVADCPMWRPPWTWIWKTDLHREHLKVVRSKFPNSQIFRITLTRSDVSGQQVFTQPFEACRKYLSCYDCAVCSCQLHYCQWACCLFKLEVAEHNVALKWKVIIYFMAYEIKRTSDAAQIWLTIMKEVLRNP